MSSKERATLLASLLLWAACQSNPANPVSDASTDASEPDASDANLPDPMCAPGTAGQSCSTCPAGSFCPGGAIPMALCATNTFDDDRDPATACVAASSCPPGSYVVAAYSRVTDQRCAPCPIGSFSTEVDTRTCTDFRKCADDEFIGERGSATKDHVCQSLRMCTADEYESVAATIQSDRECIARTLCTSGQYVSMQPTATSDRGCTSCATGFFSTSDNASECLPWRVCEAHEVESRTPTSTRDRECACQTSSDEDAGACPDP
ncbi:MAG TPA: hypothetical protein VMF89_20490 [Polyangiales bacterium]|nr:hypothetical protein [Polyangiales bacterium]